MTPTNTGAAPARVWPRIFTLSGSHGATDFYQGAIAVLIPFLVYDAGWTVAQATGLVLAATLGSSIAQPGFGVLADRYDTFWLIPASMLTAGLGIGLLGLTQDYRTALAMAAISGLGVAAYHPVAAKLARQIGGARAQPMSWFIAGGNVGLLLAPLLMAPLLISLGLGATMIVAGVSVLMAAVVIMARSWLKAGIDRDALHEVAADRQDDWPTFGFLAGVAIMRAGLYFGTSALLGIMVIDEFDAGQSMAAGVLTTYLAVGVVATLAGGYIADRWRRLVSVRLAFWLSIPGLLLIATAPNVGFLFAGAVVCGCGAFLSFSVQTTLGQEYLPHHLGTASGVTIGLSVSAGGAIAPVLGAIAENYGVRAAFLSLLVLPVVALFAASRLREQGLTRTPERMTA